MNFFSFAVVLLPESKSPSCSIRLTSKDIWSAVGAGDRGFFLRSKIEVILKIAIIIKYKKMQEQREGARGKSHKFIGFSSFKNKQFIMTIPINFFIYYLVGFILEYANQIKLKKDCQNFVTRAIYRKFCRLSFLCEKSTT